MNQFPLRTFLRNHSPIYRWAEIPASIRALFDGTDVGITHAEFFIADPKRKESHFVVTILLGTNLQTERADVVAIQNSDLGILIRYGRGKSAPQETVELVTASIECVGFRSVPSARKTA